MIEAEPRLECPAGMGGMFQELDDRGGSHASRDVDFNGCQRHCNDGIFCPVCVAAIFTSLLS